MGTAASCFDDIPNRVDLDDIACITKRFGIKVQIDIVRFDLLKDKKGTVSKSQAIQLIENKLPPIYSTNALVAELAA